MEVITDVRQESRALILQSALTKIKNPRTQWVFFRYMVSVNPYVRNSDYIELWADRFNADDVLRFLSMRDRKLYNIAKRF